MSIAHATPIMNNSTPTMTCPCEKAELESCDIETKIKEEGAVLNPICLKKYFMSKNCVKSVKLNKETSELELNFSCFSTETGTENSNGSDIGTHGNKVFYFFGWDGGIHCKKDIKAGRYKDKFYFLR